MDPLGRKRQYFSAIATSLGGFCIGTAMAFSSPSGPLLTNQDSSNGTLYLTDEEYGHYSSSLLLGAILGCLVSVFVLARVGRKWTMIVSVLPYLAGWAFIGFAQNFLMLICGRSLTGIATGFSLIATPPYIAEISEVQIRGKLCSFIQCQVVWGCLFSYCLAPLTDNFRYMAGACAIPAILLLVLVLFIRESPVYLAKKNRDQDAEESLQYFRGNADISDEYKSMISFIEEGRRNNKSLKDLFAPANRRPVLMMFTFFFFQNFCGINPVTHNLNQIFQSVGSMIDPKLSPIISALIQVVFVYTATFTVDRIGRKFLFYVSGFFLAISLSGIGIYFFLKDFYPVLAASLDWLPLVSTCTYFAAYSMGFGPLPFVFLGEMFPPETREITSGVSLFVALLYAYITAVIYIPLVNLINLYGVMWMHAACCFVSVIYAFFFIVETKGKTPQEISQLFIKK